MIREENVIKRREEDEGEDIECVFFLFITV